MQCRRSSDPNQATTTYCSDSKNATCSLPEVDFVPEYPGAPPSVVTTSHRELRLLPDFQPPHESGPSTPPVRRSAQPRLRPRQYLAKVNALAVSSSGMLPRVPETQQRNGSAAFVQSRERSGCDSEEQADRTSPSDGALVVTLEAPSIPEDIARPRARSKGKPMRSVAGAASTGLKAEQANAKRPGSDGEVSIGIMATPARPASSRRVVIDSYVSSEEEALNLAHSLDALAQAQRSSKFVIGAVPQYFGLRQQRTLRYVVLYIPGALVPLLMDHAVTGQQHIVHVTIKSCGAAWQQLRASMLRAPLALLNLVDVITDDLSVRATSERLLPEAPAYEDLVAWRDMTHAATVLTCSDLFSAFSAVGLHLPHREQEAMRLAHRCQKEWWGPDEDTADACCAEVARRLAQLHARLHDVASTQRVVDLPGPASLAAIRHAVLGVLLARHMDATRIQPMRRHLDKASLWDVYQAVQVRHHAAVLLQAIRGVPCDLDAMRSVLLDQQQKLDAASAAVNELSRKAVRTVHADTPVWTPRQPPTELLDPALPIAVEPVSPKQPDQSPAPTRLERALRQDLKRRQDKEVEDAKRREAVAKSACSLVAGMMEHALRRGRWHPRPRYLLTGRYSTTGANLQGMDKRIRRVVAPAPGRQLIKLDFSQMDLAVMLLLAGEEDKLAVYSQGGDLHSLQAYRMFDYVRKAVDSATCRLDDTHHIAAGGSDASEQLPSVKQMFPVERTKMKSLVYAYMYGGSSAATARRLGVPVTEVEQLTHKWQADFPHVRRFTEEQESGALDSPRQVFASGSSSPSAAQYLVTSLLARRMPLAAEGELTPEVAWGPRGWQSARNKSRSYPVQGSTADIVLELMARLWESPQMKELGWEPVLQVHDEVLLEGPAATGLDALHVVRTMAADPLGMGELSPMLFHTDAGLASSWSEAATPKPTAHSSEWGSATVVAAQECCGVGGGMAEDVGVHGALRVPAPARGCHPASHAGSPESYRATGDSPHLGPTTQHIGAGRLSLASNLGTQMPRALASDTAQHPGIGASDEEQGKQQLSAGLSNLHGSSWHTHPSALPKSRSASHTARASMAAGRSDRLPAQRSYIKKVLGQSTAQGPGCHQAQAAVMKLPPNAAQPTQQSQPGIGHSVAGCGASSNGQDDRWPIQRSRSREGLGAAGGHRGSQSVQLAQADACKVEADCLGGQVHARRQKRADAGNVAGISSSRLLPKQT